MPIHGITATYQPFSLQERMAPLAMMKEEYDKINEGLAELGTTANQAAQYIDPESEAGRALAQYNQVLDDAAGTLSREGMKGLSRTALYNLKRVYQSQIAPINEGAKNYFALQQKIKEMQWKDPTVMVSNMPTLDEYIKNPNTLPNVLPGSLLMQEGANAAYNLPGVTYEQLSRYLNGDASAIPDLNRTAQVIAANYGVSTNEAYAYIQRGIMAGLGKRATDLDLAKQKTQMEYEKQFALARYNQGQQNYRQSRQLAASREANYLRMFQQGWTLDDNGELVFDPQKAKEIAAAKASARGTGSGRGSTQYMHRTKGTVGYNNDGTRRKDQEIPTDATLINDITKASTEEKVLALRHAGIPIEDAKRADGTGYVPEEIDAMVSDNLDVLGAYRFWTTSKGKGTKRKVTGFWGTETAVDKEIEDSYIDFDLLGGYGSDGYYSSENEFVE